jgi:hypothetical protein
VTCGAAKARSKVCISAQVRSWHITTFPRAAEFDRYWGHSGLWPADRFMGSRPSASEPLRLFVVVRYDGGGTFSVREAAVARRRDFLIDVKLGAVIRLQRVKLGMSH